MSGRPARLSLSVQYAVTGDDLPARTLLRRWAAAALAKLEGTPVKSVEVKVDEGAWQPATMDPRTKDKYGWKLFNYAWTGATPGEHTLVSRVTDMTGKIQPTAQELENKKSFLEDNSQTPRKVMI